MVLQYVMNDVMGSHCVMNDVTTSYIVRTCDMSRVSPYADLSNPLVPGGVKQHFHIESDFVIGRVTISFPIYTLKVVILEYKGI